jgi:hypothetical protein
VLGGKLGLNRKIFDQELKQAETEAEEQKLRVVTNVRLSYRLTERGTERITFLKSEKR